MTLARHPAHRPFSPCLSRIAICLYVSSSTPEPRPSSIHHETDLSRVRCVRLPLPSTGLLCDRDHKKSSESESYSRSILYALDAYPLSRCVSSNIDPAPLISYAPSNADSLFLQHTFALTSAQSHFGNAFILHGDEHFPGEGPFNARLPQMACDVLNVGPRGWSRASASLLETIWLEVEMPWQTSRVHARSRLALPLPKREHVSQVIAYSTGTSTASPVCAVNLSHLATFPNVPQVPPPRLHFAYSPAIPRCMHLSLFDPRCVIASGPIPASSLVFELTHTSPKRLTHNRRHSGALYVPQSIHSGCLGIRARAWTP
ncbi:hypothetical protein DFH09DRAFT_1435789 [Mycena vulgaris]|nr:hypothetical protein DFH09DRAFT_1435789 [Mycena vulgaris]